MQLILFLVTDQLYQLSNRMKSISIPSSEGDLVLLTSGFAVPADCKVNGGEIEVDEAALTGESLPALKVQGCTCLMGSTVVRGEAICFHHVIFVVVIIPAY